MTEREQALADDKMRAEIARLLAETRQINDKMRAEIAKLVAETNQVKVSTVLAPALAGAAFVGATGAIVKLLF